MSLVYHAFGAHTYVHVNTVFEGGAVYFHLTKKPHRRRCMVCRSKDVTLEGRREVTLRSLPIGCRPTYFVLGLHLLLCHACGAVRQESRDVAEPRLSYTKALKRYVLELVRSMTLRDVQRRLGLGWDLIKSIVKSDLKRRANKRSLRKVRRIAIDEIAIRKGHHHLTVVLDLDTGQVLYTAPGNDHSCLEPFFQRIKKARARLRAIAVDMSRGYAKAIRLYAPANVTVVFDKYHVIALMNREIDDIRRAEQSRLDEPGRKVIKGSRFLLLYGIENLVKKEETHPLVVPRLERLDALLEANQTLYEVYMLKEGFRFLWSHRDKGTAERFLDQWLADAAEIEQPALQRFAKTLTEHREKILVHYDESISTGHLEGLNNKLKVLKRVAYSYRATEFFQLRGLFIHEVGTKVTGV